jgi:prephenate dehydrogenase
MSKITVTIAGLGRVGASLGLALKRYNARPDARHQFEITGVEYRPGVLKDLEKLDAVDRTTRSLADAARDRDIVVLALPYAEVRRAYRDCAASIRPGGVVLDLSPLKLPSAAWAAEYLPPQAHQVGATPVLNAQYLFDGVDDTSYAAADLFDKGTMLLMPAPNCVPDAVELASDFSTLIGASVRFMDPAEHDSLAGAVHGLPALLGVALFRMAAGSPGWDDIQRMTNPDFGRVTHHLFDTHPDDLRDLWLNNRDSLVRHTDSLIETLQQFRDVLAADDRDAVEAALVDAADRYTGWLSRRVSGKWDQEDAPRASSTESLMSGLMGGYLAKRLLGDRDKNSKR